MKRQWLVSLLCGLGFGCGIDYHQRPANVEPHVPAAACPNADSANDGCVPVTAALEVMRSQSFDIVGVEPAPAGVSKPAQLTLAAMYEGEPFVFEAKWKVAPDDGNAINNSPRRELAAFQLQAAFLEPQHYVVPPSVAVCIDAENHRALIADVDPQFDDTECVFGLLSYWLQDVTAEGVDDEQRLANDPEFARAFANLNVFTYLADQADARDGNILMSKSDPLVLYSIDNGLTFSAPVENIMANALKKLQVDQIPADTVARLSTLGDAQFEALATVAQFENRDGQLVPVPPTPPIEDEDDGVRYEDGVLQLGLTQSEIGQVRERWTSLMERIGSREVAVVP